MADLINLLSGTPIWIWVVGFVIVFLIFTGERILWDYEVKFPLREGVGRGKVEFERGSKKGTRVECVFELAAEYQNKPVEIYLKKVLVHTIPVEKNNSNRFRIKQAMDFDEPTEGDEVSVRIDGSEVFSGNLVLD